MRSVFGYFCGSEGAILIISTAASPAAVELGSLLLLLWEAVVALTTVSASWDNDGKNSISLVQK